MRALRHACIAALADLVPAEMCFAGRSTQPPADVVNAALSYGYAIVLSESVSALCVAGLDPGIGMLHTEQERRPSLGLDLMEEFRPLIVDQVVIAAARRGELKPEHGRRHESVHGVLLNKADKEVLVSGYERVTESDYESARLRRGYACRFGARPGNGGSIVFPAHIALVRAHPPGPDRRAP